MEINRGRDGSWQRSKRFRYQSLGDGEFLFLGKVHINNEISRRDQFIFQHVMVIIFIESR